MMPTPRDVLLAAVEACLKRVTRANGAWTDAGEVVTLEPHQMIADVTPKQAASVIWEKTMAAPPQVRAIKRTVQFSILIKSPAQFKFAQNTINKLADDIETEMTAHATDWPRGYSRPQFIEAVPIAPEQAVGWAGVLVRYTSDIPITNRGKTQ